MSQPISLSTLTESLLMKFLERYGIESIDIEKNVNFRNDREISEVVLTNSLQVNCVTETYLVRFKLQEEGADTCQYLVRMIAKPQFKIEFTEQARTIATDELEKRLLNFLALIKTRVEKAKQEQEVQSIRFVGNTFMLNKSTTFRVLADDGEGRLDIEILGGDGLQELMFSAHGLLDGLYTGFIELVEERQVNA